MAQQRTVLVGIDVDDDNVEVLRWGWQEARARSLPLVVTTIYRPARQAPRVGGQRLPGHLTPEQQRRKITATLRAHVVDAHLPPPDQHPRREPLPRRRPSVQVLALRPHEVDAVAAGALLLVLPWETHDEDSDYLTGETRRRLVAACDCPTILIDPYAVDGTDDGTDEAAQGSHAARHQGAPRRQPELQQLQRRHGSHPLRARHLSELAPARSPERAPSGREPDTLLRTD